MKKLLTGILLVIMVAVVWRYLPMGAHLATGYSAKQLCSGIFVAGLPEEFIVERDILPRMATLGPALPLLKLETDTGASLTKASFLGFSSTAQYQPGTGCTLNPLPNGAVANIQRALPKVEAAQAALAPQGALTATLQQAFAEPPGGGRNTLAVLVMHRGELIAERYLAPVTATTPLQGWSMNKSLIATWIGMQVKKQEMSLSLGVVEGLRASGENVEDIAHKIDTGLTLFNLLHMESGFDFVETYEPGDDATQMLYNSSAMWRAAPQQGHSHAPGDYFSYSSGDANLAAFLWQASLQGEPYARWLANNFSGPLGLTRFTAEHDASGVQVGSSYTYMTGRDWLRVGQFWLDAWHDRTELLPAGWQRGATKPTRSNYLGNYGLSFWLNTQGSQFPSLPKNLFNAGGNAGQRVMVFPDQELVIVRLGLTQSGVDQGVELLSRQVLDIVEG